MINKKKIQVSNLDAIIICFCVGTFLGALIANKINYNSCTQVDFLFKNFLSMHEANNLFITELVKHARVIIFIWFMAFVPWGYFFVCVILILKALTYGFTSSFLFKTYKLDAFSYIAKYIMPHGIILICVMIFTASYCINYSQFDSDSCEKSRINLEYFCVLIISLAFVLLATLIEIYLIKLK